MTETTPTVTVHLTELQTKALLYALEDAGAVYEVDEGEGVISAVQLVEFQRAFGAVVRAAAEAGVDSLNNPPEWEVKAD